MRFLVTAGPTHEHIDPVRYLANASSGKMGFAIARAALRRGHRVTLVSGPTALRIPPGVTFAPVVSASAMGRAVLREIPRSQCLVMAAAVSDYRPARTARGKIPKGRERWSVPLVRNPDILAGIRRRPGRRIVVGFSLETGRAEARARRKMAQKDLDFIVLNSPAAIGSNSISCRFLFPDGGREVLHDVSKAMAARRIVRWVETLWQGPRSPRRPRGRSP